MSQFNFYAPWLAFNIVNVLRLAIHLTYSGSLLYVVIVVVGKFPELDTFYARHFFFSNAYLSSERIIWFSIFKCITQFLKWAFHYQFLDDRCIFQVAVLIQILLCKYCVLVNYLYSFLLKGFPVFTHLLLFDSTCSEN